MSRLRLDAVAGERPLAHAPHIGSGEKWGLQNWHSPFIPDQTDVAIR